MKPACKVLYVAFGTLPSGESIESWACSTATATRSLFREQYKTATLTGVAAYQLESVDNIFEGVSQKRLE